MCSIQNENEKINFQKLKSGENNINNNLNFISTTININNTNNFFIPTTFTTLSKKDYSTLKIQYQDNLTNVGINNNLEDNLNFDTYTTKMDQQAHRKSSPFNSSSDRGQPKGDDNKTTTTTTTTTTSSSSRNKPRYNNNNNYSKGIKEWSSEKVGEWLSSNGFKEYVDKFKDQKIDGNTLMVINDMKQSDPIFDQLGFIHLGPKINFQNKLKQLISTPTPTPKTTTASRNENKNPHKVEFNTAIGNINKKNDEERKKKEQFESFKGSYDMECYLKKKISQINQDGDDIVELLHHQITQLKDILSRPQLPNSVIELIISIFTNPKFESTTVFDTFKNRLIAELKNSNFFLSILNFQKYVQEITLLNKFKDTINLMNLVSSTFKDSIQLFPIDLFEARFNTYYGRKLDNSEIDRIKQLIKILKQKKLLIINQQKDNIIESGMGGLDLLEINYKNRSVIPSREEIHSKSLPALRPLKIGIYNSAEEYIDTQFNLIREDMVHPIREALALIESGKSSPYYYTDVIFKGFTKTNTTLSLLIEFKYRSKIRWEKFSKLLNGSLLVLSCDGFQNILIATVDKRPDKGDVQNISISFYNDNGNQDSLNVNHHHHHRNLQYLFENSFQMIESPTYFESVRNVLTSLQRINTEELPFQSYLLKCSSQEVLPKYFQDNPVINLQKIFPNSERINIKTSEFPEELGTLDPSQIEAFEHCLKSKISLVQGPPGSGKSYLGSTLFKVIHNHLKETSPQDQKAPILVLCYTNHALDQFLNHIIDNVTNDVIRIGSRSRDERMKDYHIRKFVKPDRRQYAFYKERDDVVAVLKNYLDTFSNELTYQDFLNYANDNTKLQLCDSYKWIKWLKSIHKLIKKDLTILKSPKVKQQQANHDEDDEDDEELVETLLNERRFDYGEGGGRGGNNNDSIDISEYDIQSIIAMTRLEKRDYEDIEDINDIEEEERIYYYRWLLDKKIKESLEIIQEYADKYRTLSNTILDYENKSYQIALSNVSVVAATITGASKFKKVFDSINSKCVIIEEAAEVLEGHIVSVLPKTIEHLILIGDHEQLRPSTAVYQLAQKYGLDVSLFERVIKMGSPHRQLLIQRRMVPNISQFIHPIYPNLRNHPEVRKRFENNPNIKGMPSNLFFLSHNQPESSSTESTSKSNPFEADFIVSLANYLIQQEYKPSDIVILTPYTGQLLKIKNQIRNRKSELLSKVSVRSIDQYQGEESDIVLLSLVRSNSKGECGFVKIRNRINVAISRARNAMYMVGNRELLANANPLWANMFVILEESNLIGPVLNLHCENHADQVTPIKSGPDFINVPQGGCLKSCESRLECGHTCGLACHIYDRNHLDIQCTKPCEVVHSKCGHACTKLCSADCGTCNQLVERVFQCGHTRKIPCHIDPLEYKCKELCKKIKRCGHPCVFTCSDFCEKEKCKVMVKKTLACGHRVEKECFNNSDVCNNKCKEILPCGDQCSAKCKDHQRDANSGATIHPPCSKKLCSRELFCGHQCKSKHACSSGSCGECKSKCANDCSHSVCNKPCGKLCNPCNEQCKRGCIHVGRCSKKCKEECDIKLCNEPCKKKLPCKHNCIGLCGEKCPSKCRICDADYLEPISQMKLSEFDATDRFIEIHKGHIFFVDNLDTYMNIKDDQGRVTLKKCPSCQMVISAKDVPRYKDIINQNWFHINSIKKKLMEVITKQEQDQVVQAMGGAAGHWFSCPNGHYYYIGECGGAMQTGKCIECKSDVGGTNHKLLDSNKHSNLDGSNSPLYRPYIPPPGEF